MSGNMSALAAHASAIKGKKIIIVKDHPVMWEVFDGLPMTAAGITYLIGNLHGTGDQRTGELIIRNREEGFGVQTNLP